MYSRDEVRALQDKMSRIFLVSIFPLFIFLLFNLTRCFNLPSDHEFFFSILKSPVKETVAKHFALPLLFATSVLISCLRSLIGLK
jgi:hypothetical protein